MKRMGAVRSPDHPPLQLQQVKLQPLVAALGPRKKGANRQGVFSEILGTAVAGGLRVGAAQDHAFHALAPSLARSSSHTR